MGQLKSSSNRVNRSRKTTLWVIFVFAVSIIALMMLWIGQLVVVSGTRISQLPQYAIDVISAFINRSSINSDEFTNILFLHHSTGEYLILDGNIREKLTTAGYQFWDHGYNFQGLTDAEGNLTGYSYNIPSDNTDPDGLVTIFNQDVYPWPINALSGILQYDVIILKSCFMPTSKITTKQQLVRYQSDYLNLRDRFREHPDKIFILLTQPPLNPSETNPQEAARARELASWLASPDYMGSDRNIFVLDYFALLAENDSISPDYNMLRDEYRWGTDSHPNELANQTIAPLFVDFVIETIKVYQSVYD